MSVKSAEDRARRLLTETYWASQTTPSAAGPAAPGTPMFEAQAASMTRDPANRRRAALEEDTALLYSDPDKLGLTDDQKDAYAKEAAQPARTSAQGQSSMLARAALGTDTPVGATMASAQRELQDVVDEAEVAAQPGIRDLHNQIIDMERARLTGEAEELQRRRQENSKYWAQFAVDTAATVAALAATASGVPVKAKGVDADPEGAPVMETDYGRASR